MAKLQIVLKENIPMTVRYDASMDCYRVVRFDEEKLSNVFLIQDDAELFAPTEVTFSLDRLVQIGEEIVSTRKLSLEEFSKLLKTKTPISSVNAANLLTMYLNGLLIGSSDCYYADAVQFGRPINKREITGSLAGGMHAIYSPEYFTTMRLFRAV